MDTEKKLRTYLDTTIPNHLFADDKPDWMAATWQLWDKCMAGEYEIFVSDVFFDELNRCPQPKRGQMYGELGQIQFKNLKESDEVNELAAEYIKGGVLTKKNLNDCLHIAYAVVHDCDVILSWNFDHTREWTKGKVKEVNAINRYKGIGILSPIEFLEGGYK